MRSGVLTGNDTGGAAQVASAYYPNERILDPSFCSYNKPTYMYAPVSCKLQRLAVFTNEYVLPDVGCRQGKTIEKCSQNIWLKLQSGENSLIWMESCFILYPIFFRVVIVTLLVFLVFLRSVVLWCLHEEIEFTCNRRINKSEEHVGPTCKCVLIDLYMSCRLAIDWINDWLIDWLIQ